MKLTMVKKRIPILLFLISIMSLACSFTGKIIPSAVTPTQEAPRPNDAQVDGFSAEATDESSVLLQWEPVQGANQYLLEIKIGDEYISLATLPADQTMYEDELVPSATQLTYRLSNLAGNDIKGKKEISVLTKDLISNPLQITPEFDMSAPTQGIDIQNLDPNSFDPKTFDPKNFDLTKISPQPNQAEALIGVQGGEISITSSTGIQYTLRVPPNSLRADVFITLLPISAIPDLPLEGGLVAAVLVGPTAMVFDIPAELEIAQPADFVMPSEPFKMGFAFQNEGHEFHLYPIQAAANQGYQKSQHTASVQAIPPLAGPLSDILNIKSGGGFGTGKGTKADIKKNIKNTPSKSQAQLEQHIAASTADDELVPLPSPAAMEFGKIAEQILQKASRAKGWDTFMEAVDDFSAYMNAGGDKYNSGLNEKIVSLLIEKANSLLKQNKADCLTYNDFISQELVERLTNPKDKVSKILADRFKQTYGQRLLDDLAFGNKDCTYELSLQSTLSYDVGNSKITTTASAPKMKLFLTYHQGDIFLWGGGIMDLGVEVTGKCAFPVTHYKDLNFFAEKLWPVFENGRLKDFNLNAYRVNGWVKNASLQVQGVTQNCPNLVTIQGGGDFWTGMFLIARDMDPITNWQVSTKNGVTATWSRENNNFTPSGIKGTMIETTKLELRVVMLKK